MSQSQDGLGQGFGESDYDRRVINICSDVAGMVELPPRFGVEKASANIDTLIKSIAYSAAEAALYAGTDGDKAQVARNHTLTAVNDLRGYLQEAVNFEVEWQTKADDPDEDELAGRLVREAPPRSTVADGTISVNVEYTVSVEHK